MTLAAGALGLLAALSLGATRAQAGCLTLISGPVAFDVYGCKLIQPEQVFDLHKDKYSWIAGLDAAGRKKFMDTYRGLYIKGKVVKSNATSKGLDPEQGALNGQTVYMYMPPGAEQCNAVLGKRLAGDVHEVCCEGGGDAPCLLDTGYLLLHTQVVGSASSGAGDARRHRARTSADYKAADKAYMAHKWKDAARDFEKARVNGELDVAGYYKLGYSLRELEQCSDAVAPLRQIQSEWMNKQIWADEELDARKCVFLLARCLAKMNDPGGATMILNGYLLEPKKYQAEIYESLHNGDFGYIHTSKEYRDYQKDANKKLRALGGGPGAKN